MRMSILVGVLMIGLLSFGSASSAAAQHMVHQVHTTKAAYATSSDEGREIAHWLQQQADNGEITSTGLGVIEVAYTARTASAQPMTNPGPPMPLPASGNPGDEISITHTSGNWQQSWTFVWRSNGSGGGWFQTRHERVYVDLLPR